MARFQGRDAVTGFVGGSSRTKKGGLPRAAFLTLRMLVWGRISDRSRPSQARLLQWECNGGPPAIFCAGLPSAVEAGVGELPRFSQRTRETGHPFCWGNPLMLLLNCSAELPL